MSRNNVQQTAIRIPRTRNQDSFRKMVKKTNFVDNIIDNLTDDSIASKEEGIEWLLDEIAAKDPETFKNVALKKGLVDFKRMSAEETAAMLTEARCTMKQGRIINQHLFSQFKRRLLAKELDVSALGKDAIPPVTDWIKWNKTKVWFWWKKPTEVLTKEICSLVKLEEVDDVSSIDMSVGGDHGGGRFRVALILVIRFKDPNKPFRRRVFIHGEIDSNKDKAELLRHTFLPKINTEMKKIMEHENIWFSVNDGKLSLSFEGGEGEGVPTRAFICGDGKFFMQVLGRENMASHWCPFCKAQISTCRWDNKDKWLNTDEPEWTLQELKNQLEKNNRENLKGAARMGVVEEPIFDFVEVCNILPNILHEQINLANNLVENIYEFIEWVVEVWAEEDREIRDKFLEAQQHVANMEKDLSEMENEIQEIQDDIADLDPSTENAEMLRKDWNEQLTEKMQNKEFVRNSVLAPAKKKLAASKKQFRKHWEDKKLSDTRVKLDNDIFVDKFNYNRKPYHGDKFTGKEARSMMERREELCAAIKELLLEVVADQHNEKKNNDIKRYIDLVESYLAVLSNLFSRLRKFHGQLTEEDYKEMERSANLLPKLAEELQLSYTPSMHILHKHAVALCRKHGGFGELLEDLIEQMHQEMGRLHRRFAGMGSCRKRAETMSKAIEMEQNPGVQEVLQRVDFQRKRNLKEPQKAQDNQEAAKQERKKRREEAVEQEMSRAQGPAMNVMQLAMDEMDAKKSSK
jgi:hypothetical protein